MHKHNEQEKTWPLRGAENTSQRSLDSHFDSNIGSMGSRSGTEPLGDDRDDSEIRGTTSRTGEGVTGKMLNHLISECRNQVILKRQEIENLLAQVDNLEALKKEFLASMGDETKE